MTHPADCPCFNCVFQHVARFTKQLIHEPWYEREEERCSVCEIRKDEHGEDFPCRYEDDSEETNSEDHRS